jgi:hypothetical protein
MTDALGLERSLADSFMGFIVSLFNKSKRLSYESSRVLRFKNAICYRMTELSPRPVRHFPALVGGSRTDSTA